MPESEPARASQIAVDVERPDFDAAVKHAQELVTLYGASGHRAELKDVEVTAGRLHDATRIANRMLVAGGEGRAEAWLQLGRIAVLEGRFSDAREALSSAATEGRPYGYMGALNKAAAERVDLALVEGREADIDAALRELVDIRRTAGTPGAPVLELEQRLFAQRSTCPNLTSTRRAAATHPDWSARMFLRVAATAGCVPCAEVVRAGLDGAERDRRWLFDFGVCAEKAGALELARDAFHTVQRVATATTDAVTVPSTTHAVLARLHLARVLGRLGRKGDARAAYEDFLAHWGRANRPVPEVDAARKELEALK